MTEQRKIRNDIVAIVLLTVIVFLVASLATYDPADAIASPVSALDQLVKADQLVYPLNAEVQNACGRLGAWTSGWLIQVLGFGAYYFVVGLIALEIALFQRHSVTSPWLKTIGWMLSLIGLTALGSILLPTWSGGPIISSGGYLGALGQGLLAMNFGSVGSIIIALSVSMIGLMMWTEYLVFKAGRFMFAPAFVAASKVLPFGILFGFLTWFNKSDETTFVPTDLEDGIEDELDDDDEFDEEPISIRFRRRDLKQPESEVDDDEEYEDEEFEEDGEEESSTIPFVAASEAVDEDEEEYEVEDYDDDEELEELAEPVQQVVPAPHFNVKRQAKPKSEREVVMDQLNEAALADASADYELPSLNLLVPGKEVSFEQQQKEAFKQAKILERTCKEFGYNVKVVEVETGPVISQYEIQLEAGLRLQKITALNEDLAIALRVPSVRIVAPIPGKNTVGIEVPNESRAMVRLRDVMQQSEDQVKKMHIPLFLGQDAVGAPMLADLAKLPHLLIAGRTGTGKSVCLNAIISSILMTRRPDEVRMLMIDPKMVELSGYGRLPHLMHPVVTDMRKAEAILAWAVDKMEERYRLLAKAGVRHLTSYNQLGQEELYERLKPENDSDRAEIPNHLPFIVIVADEMADLMMTAGKEVEQHIIRLAQKSRAVGIHLILATQKPTVDVITGLIKSNLPARIAFQVASKMDSRVVLDAMGADKLLGMGDMLFLKPGTSMLLRGQGTFLADDEIDRITDQVSTGEQNFVHELVNIKLDAEGDGSEDAPQGFESRDDKYLDAVDLVVKEQRGSVSLLQRALAIGYGRAARLIDFMEEDGFVGPYSGSKAREVLLTSSQWDNIKNGSNGSEFTEVDSTTEEEAPLKPVKSRLQKSSRLAASSTSVPFPVKEPSKKQVEPEFEDEDEYEYVDDDEEYEDDEAIASADVDEEEYEYEYEDDEEYEDVDDEEYDEDEQEEYEEEYDEEYE